MKLFTKEVNKAFDKQGYTGEKSGNDIKIVCKLFAPIGGFTWWLYEKENDDIYWAFCLLNDPTFAESGKISIKEIDTAFRSRYGIGIERDMYFEPLSKTLEEVRIEVKNMR